MIRESCIPEVNFMNQLHGPGLQFGTPAPPDETDSFFSGINIESNFFSGIGQDNLNAVVNVFRLYISQRAQRFFDRVNVFFKVQNGFLDF